MHHYELFNYDYRGVVVSFQGTKVHGNETSIIRCTSVRLAHLAGKGLAEMFTSCRSEYNWALTRLGRDVRRDKSGPELGGLPADTISVPADSASEIVKFTISIPRESCTNAKAKYSSSVVPPDPSVHFYH